MVCFKDDMDVGWFFFSYQREREQKIIKETGNKPMIITVMQEIQPKAIFFL